MTLREQMINDVSSVFLNTGEHAETIVSQALGSSPKDIVAVVEREQANLFVAASDGTQERKQATIYLSTDPDEGEASIKEGHVFKFDDLVWKVASATRQGGYGMHQVVVYHDVQTELSRQDYWRQR